MDAGVVSGKEHREGTRQVNYISASLGGGSGQGSPHCKNFVLDTYHVTWSIWVYIQNRINAPLSLFSPYQLRMDANMPQPYFVFMLTSNLRSASQYCVITSTK